MALAVICASAWVPQQVALAGTQDLGASVGIGELALLPPSVDSEPASAGIDGFSSFSFAIQAGASTSVTNPTITVNSGFSPSTLLQGPGAWQSGGGHPLTSLPYVATQASLNPLTCLCDGLASTMGLKSSPGFDSSRAVSPLMIPIGGTNQTVTVAVTLRPPGPPNGFFKLSVDSPVPGASVVSATGPGGGSTHASGGSVQFDPFGLALDTPYTFTAVMHVPNPLGSPFASKPHVGLLVAGPSTLPSTTTGTSANMAVPKLDGPAPDSGSVGFSVSDSHTWSLTTNPFFALNYAANQDIAEFPIPSPSSAPVEMAAGPDGNLWFTENNSNKVARVTPSGAITEYTAPTASSTPNGITSGPDDNLWFTEFDANRIARLTTAGAITEFVIPTGSSGPLAIAAGADGNLWFTEFSANQVGRVTPSGVFTEFPIPSSNSAPKGIAAGPDGNLWFTEANANKVARITTAGVVTEFPIPTSSSGPNRIARGPDGNLWFTESGASKVAKVTTGATFTEYPTPNPNSMPHGIARGPDGRIWVTEGNNNLASVATDGSMMEFPLPTAGVNPSGVAAGPDGNVWFAEGTGNNVGKIDTGVGVRCPIDVSSPATRTVSSTGQYSLSNSNGTSWQEIDSGYIHVSCTPAVDQSVLLTANADLWTANAGYNQDIGIFVNVDGSLTDTLVAWKEAGGYAGTFSPNAAFVQAPFSMTNGHAYTFKLKWKTNKNAPGATIYAGAGPIGGNYSPTSLAVQVFPSGAAPASAVRTQQFTLSNSDGATWRDLDLTTPSDLWTTISPAGDSTAVLGANVDLFTGNAGYNQDVAIFVSDPAVNSGADQLVAWKESGGFAGIFSPNAAFIKATWPMTGTHSYTFKMKWKTNRSAPGKTIFAGAGTGPYSPTSLIVQSIATGLNPYGAVSTVQDTQSNPSGTTWQPFANVLPVTVSPLVTTNAVLGANADLFTNTAGYNQDIGIFVNDNSTGDRLVVWKESGGFAGIFSPNAAFAQGVFRVVKGHTYVFTLKWKTNRNGPGVTIYAGAGVGVPYSATRLTAELTA